MSSARTFRWSGPAAMLGGVLALVLLVTNVFTSAVPEEVVATVMLTVIVLLLSGVAGLYGRTRPGALGTAGLAIAAAGLVAIITGAVLVVAAGFDGGWSVMVLGVLSHPVGLLIYGIANLQARALPRWNTLPLIVGLVSGPGVLVMRVVQEIAGLYISERADPAWSLWVVSIGVGWILLGYLLISERSETAQNPQPAT